jgi:hypothetical protein
MCVYGLRIYRQNDRNSDNFGYFRNVGPYGHNDTHDMIKAWVADV